MFAVVGEWQTDPTKSDLQRRGLEGIVAGVRQTPGVISGHWTANISGSRSHTFILFDQRPRAEVFAEHVVGNAEAQQLAGVNLLSLDILEVIAST